MTLVTVDGAQAGVGGIDSWGSLPMMQHRLNGQEPCTFTFAMMFFSEGSPRSLPQRAASLVMSTR